MDSDSQPNESNDIEPSLPEEEDKKWWETLEGHRFAGVVLQLQIRRKIMKLIGSGNRTREEIKRTFGLTDIVADMHLDLLEKAVMIERFEGGYKSTSLGTAYLKNFEDFEPKNI